MRTFPRLLVFMGILVLGALNISVYWNSHLYARAVRLEDPQARISLLERSNAYYPLNELVHYELGKTYANLGIEEIAQPRKSEQDFRTAVQYLKRSIMINPASPYAHFYLGQSLLHLGLSSAVSQSEVYAELKKAISLGENDSRLGLEAGRLFFSRWPELSTTDRELTLRVLKRTLARRDPGQAVLLMNIWDMNVGDPAVMEKILPADAALYRLYAVFLGERSLFLAERLKFLAQAERLDFVSARREYERAQAALFRLRTGEALDSLGSGLRLLRGIRFYQTLIGQSLISADEYTDLLKSFWLELANCRLAEGAAFAEFEPDLRRYLALENRPKEISGLENTLRSRGLLEAKPGLKFDDMKRLAFELLLYFKQTRYREIISVGRELSRSVAVIPPERKKDYAEVLGLIGDSYQKIDYLYDAGDFYRKALEMDPDNFETLLRIRQNLDRLNEDRKLREIDSVIEAIEAPREIVSSPLPLERGNVFTRSLTFRRGRVTLDFLFAPQEKNNPSSGPLIAVSLNGRVVREDFVRDGKLLLDMEMDDGENVLQILPVNRPVSLVKLGWRQRSGDRNTPNSRSLK